MPSGKTDKATIVDNKDGTVKITYEPKEEGAHEISLRYNDEPVDDGPIVFYVDSVGSAKKKITAYGPGLTRGLVGEQNKFTINTGGLGSAKLNVTVEGPSKTQVELSDNRDGTITVSYSALVPGEYKIKISFDGKQVVGSPFITEINDEGRQRSHLNVGRASEHTLDFKISEEDLKTIDAIIVTPCGLEEPAELKLMKNGQLAIMFTPREQGDHIVNVKRRGNHIAGSPFRFDVLSRDIGDAKQVKVSGKGLKEGKANAENEIIINTKDAGYGGLSVALEGPGRSEILSKEVTDSTIKLSYQPYEPGQYSLMVKYADHVVPGSPFSIKVSGQGTNSQKESFRKFRKLQPVAEPNTECHFSFKQPSVSAYDLSAKIHSPQGSSEDVSIKDKGDFVYQVSFVPKEVGLFALSIRNKEIHIAGSPFPFTVGPLLDFGPHKVRCGGPGLIKGAVNKLNEFDIYTREAGTGELHVVMEGPSKPELKYTDRKDGSCHVGYKVSQAGEYRVSVFFNDHEVPDSPFRTVVMAPTGDVAKIELGPMPPDSMIQLNKPYNMTVIMNGAKGNIEGKVKVPSGKIEDCFASPIDAENWGVRFIPREYGIYQVYIKCKGSHIPQSPLFVRVGHDNADPAAILVHGHGLRAAIVNHATDFIVETCNAGHSMLEVNIEGPSKVSMGCAELDEGYKINYTPLAPGDYLISIKYNGCHIGSSPFKVRATKQPGSRTVADAGSHEISTIAISTTDREAKQKVEHMPKFKSDATRVYCKGMGLKKAFAGKPNTLTVNCSEAGFNMIYVSFLGPNRNTIHECSVKHMGGQIYEVKYTCKDKGDAMLMVKYGDEQIPGSPFKLECV
uniref:Filamin-A n=1 Tax=Aceria tosichella TaxID=561515 RepID=A0A6G1SDR5_9ACAR